MFQARARRRRALATAADALDASEVFDGQEEIEDRTRDFSTADRDAGDLPPDALQDIGDSGVEDIDLDGGDTDQADDVDLDDTPVVQLTEPGDIVEQGRVLVEGAGHCGECHTPRGRFGNLLHENWLAGAPSPEGEGRVPNITPGGKNISSWSASDIAYYLESGFTPEFDTVGGTMVAVQENMARLTDQDRRAIAAYLKAIPGIE